MKAPDKFGHSTHFTIGLPFESNCIDCSAASETCCDLLDLLDFFGEPGLNLGLFNGWSDLTFIWAYFDVLFRKVTSYISLG